MSLLPFSRPLNTDTWIIRTLWRVPLVSVLTGFHCTSQNQREDYNFFYLGGGGGEGGASQVQERKLKGLYCVSRL